MAHEQQALADLPPLPEFSSTVSLGPGVRRALQEMCAAIYQLDYEYRRQLGSRANLPEPWTDEKLQAVLAFLERGPESWDATSRPQLNSVLLYDERQVAAVRRLLEHPDLPPAAMARLLVYTGYFRPIPNRGDWLAIPGLRDLVKTYWDHHDLGMPLGLRELSFVLKSAGIDPEIIGRLRLHMGNWQSFTWESDAATRPYFAEHLNLLEEALEMGPGQTHANDFWWRYHRNQRRQAAFEILAMFPVLPEQFREYCWRTALGTAKKDRLPALQALHREPDITGRLVAELRNSKQEVRAAAADWLGQRGERAAIEPLKNAFAKEKKEVVKAAFLGALERLGVPADQLLNRDELLNQAEKSQQKGVPDELSWFPFERLPPVHWQDNGAPVPELVVKHLIMEAHKLKSPEPSAMLRCYAAAMRRAEAAELGYFVLSSWIAHDTTLPTPEEADQAAQRMMGTYGAYGGGAYQQILQTCQQTPLGSAIKTKGILAVAGAGCDGRAAQLVGQYLRTWYGMRAAQCKALLPMLLWVDHPAAVQLLLSTAQRFRTAGIRKEAQRCVLLLAERRDWTVAELADRSIPTCGLDEKRDLVLDYGERRFVAHLDDDLNFALRDEDGKALTVLPEPRKSEDAERVNRVKKEFADARKALKTLLKQQQERFYEAMCTEREWCFADWDAFLHRHPIVSRLCQRLVWAVFQDGKAITSFRPLPDGTLSNLDDESVELDANATIRLAHETSVPAADGPRWLQHFSDYEAAPLFDQFGKPVYQLAAEQKTKTEVQDFQGHMIEAFKLRGRATKLGYTRGPIDGGWFYRYQKQLPTVGIEVVLEFSGNGLPEENRTVALGNLHFVRSAAAEGAPGALLMSLGRDPMRMPLGEVPVILLNECWNDLRTIAAEGAGFDPDWEKKVHQ